MITTTNFEQLVAQYAQAAPKLGPAQFLPADALRRDLQAMIRRNGLYFLAIFVLLAVLLLLCTVMLGHYFDQPARAATLLGAGGISIPFILRMMFRMWESKVKAEALLLLATSLDEKVLRMVVMTLAHRGTSTADMNASV
jgi:hypothetical protein